MLLTGLVLAIVAVKIFDEPERFGYTLKRIKRGFSCSDFQEVEDTRADALESRPGFFKRIFSS
jgi:hypothetical protein